MRVRWIAPLACLLIAGCNKPTENSSPKGNPATVSSEAKQSSAAVNTVADSDADLPDEENSSFVDQLTKNQAQLDAVMNEHIKLDSRENFATADAQGKEKLTADLKDLRAKHRRLGAKLAEETLEQLQQKSLADDETFRGLFFIFQSHPTDKVELAARTFAMKNCRDSPYMAMLCDILASGEPSAANESLFKNLIENSEPESVKAAALWSLIKLYNGAVEFRNQGIPEDQLPGFVKSFDASKLDLESLHVDLVQKFGDLEYYGESYADLAGPALFKLRNLAVGKTAPDIEGKDLDGKEFKLSDYRGKVVMLDFWGDW